MVDKRALRFTTLDEAIAEAERLASGEHNTTGNFTFAQILNHLSTTFDVAVGRKKIPPVPLYMRVIARVFRPFVLQFPMRPGFKLPDNSQALFWSTDELSLEKELAYFREAAHRLVAAESLPKHPVFGRMSRKQHLKLQCRHCELHLGFVHPA